MDWPMVVQKALQLDTYTSEEQIKSVLKKRFRSGRRVDGAPADWYRYLVRQDELNRRNRLLLLWGKLFREGNLEVIPYDINLDELERKVRNEMGKRNGKGGN